MAITGWDLVYQKSANLGTGLFIEGGDPTYYEVSTTYISVATKMSHVVMGFITVDSSDGITAFGRASPRIGDPSGGVLDFSFWDVTETDSMTYFAIGW